MEQIVYKLLIVGLLALAYMVYRILIADSSESRSNRIASAITVAIMGAILWYGTL